MAAVEGAVVVGNDGSTEGYRAVRWAADEARRLGSGLHIVHAWLWPFFKVDLGPPAHAPAGAGLQVQAEAILVDSAEHAHVVAPDLPVTTSLVTGDAAPQLLRLATGARMLVVGNRGLGGSRACSLGLSA